METLIRSIELKKLDNGNCYWELTLIDEQGNFIGKFGNQNINDAINFRKQTFGILSACNCFDLVRLGSSNPKYLPILIKEKKFGGVEYISSIGGKNFKLGENCQYEITKSWNIFNKNKEMKKYTIGQIERIVSQSGVFTIWLRTENYMTFFNTGQIYYGFGYPLPASSENLDENYINQSALIFKTFIEGILEIYGTKDLLKLSENKEIEYPKISVNVDEKGNILSIGSLTSDYELTENNSSYSISQKEKIRTR